MQRPIFLYFVKMKSDLETICTRNIRSLPLHVHEVGAAEASTIALQEADVPSHDIWDVATTLRNTYNKAIFLEPT